jgi:lipopolysaccharide/colanic/teichoic acid biosynthesis glycosyltransferase
VIVVSGETARENLRPGKRILDVVAATCGLVLLSPCFVLIAILVKADSKGPVFFRQKRVGRGFHEFRILKFRTMIVDAPLKGGDLTEPRDPRITPIGRILRKAKIDELPQLINVFRGEMSLVGPRPEVPRYVELFRGDYEELLQVRPGITDLASLKYRDESSVLGEASDPEHEYVTRILPDKIALAREYLQRASLSFDMWVIVQTIVQMGRKRPRHTSIAEPAIRKRVPEASQDCSHGTHLSN